MSLLLKDSFARHAAQLAEVDQSTRSLFAKIKVVVSDVDGVLTDGGLYYDSSGECLKRFNVRDGLGMKMLEACGIDVVLMSGRDSNALRARVKDLNLKNAGMFGIKDKADGVRSIASSTGVSLSEIACIGDDTIDLPAFAECAVSVTVSDATDYIKAHASYVLKSQGGQGAFREFSDLLLLCTGKASVFSSAIGYSAIMSQMKQ